MRTSLDSSVLIQLYRKQEGWERWRDLLQVASQEGTLLICPIAFAEYAIAYPTVEAALEDIERLHIVYDPINPEAAYLAGRIFLSYRREGGPRQHLIPDFLVAAHASIQADRIATVDRGYLRAYFPQLQRLEPSP
jgi:predicted nucleic acid-binding protein